MELIDTLWNVNIHTVAFVGYDKKELIDTLWNVNTVAADLGMIIPTTN